MEYVQRILNKLGGLKRDRIPFDVEQVVGDGVSQNLPTFSSRLYYEAKSIREFLDDFHVKRCLEIGCGYARLTPYIAEYSDEMYAIEPEKKLFEIARKLYPMFNFLNTPVDKMPFPNNYFGLIVSWTVLQHIPPIKLRDSISEILRVAQDDAVILIAEYTKKTASPTTWGHSLEEYSRLFKPFRLVKHEPRKVENSSNVHMGEVMKFQKIRLISPLFTFIITPFISPSIP